MKGKSIQDLLEAKKATRAELLKMDFAADSGELLQEKFERLNLLTEILKFFQKERSVYEGIGIVMLISTMATLLSVVHLGSVPISLRGSSTAINVEMADFGQPITFSMLNAAMRLEDSTKKYGGRIKQGFTYDSITISDLKTLDAAGGPVKDDNSSHEQVGSKSEWTFERTPDCIVITLSKGRVRGNILARPHINTATVVASTNTTKVTDSDELESFTLGNGEADSRELQVCGKLERTVDVRFNPVVADIKEIAPYGNQEFIAVPSILEGKMSIGSAKVVLEKNEFVKVKFLDPLKTAGVISLSPLKSDITFAFVGDANAITAGFDEVGKTLMPTLISYLFTEKSWTLIYLFTITGVSLSWAIRNFLRGLS